MGPMLVTNCDAPAETKTCVCKDLPLQERIDAWNARAKEPLIRWVKRGHRIDQHRLRTTLQLLAGLDGDVALSVQNRGRSHLCRQCPAKAGETL